MKQYQSSITLIFNRKNDILQFFKIRIDKKKEKEREWVQNKTYIIQNIWQNQMSDIMSHNHKRES